MPLRVDFAEGCGISIADRDYISDALSDVAVSEDETPPSGSGCWSSRIHTVTVLRRLAGGRSGSEVLEIRTDGDGSSLQVAKLSDRREAVREWKAFSTVTMGRDYALYVPIVAVSRSVLDEKYAVDFGRHVVVYQHVQDRDGSTTAAVRSVEDLIDEAITGDEAQAAHAVTVLSSMMGVLGSKLYRGAESRKDQLLNDENRTLGNDLELKIDGFSLLDRNVLRLTLGLPSAADLDDHVVQYGMVLRASACPPGADRCLSKDDKVRLRLDNITFDGTRVSGELKTARVKVRLTGQAAERNELAQEISQHSVVEVYGQVESTRAERWSTLWADRLSQCGGFLEEKDSITCQGSAVGHPLRSLHEVLSSSAEPRTRSRVHGDLNPRNVMLCGSNPYLIDFASSSVDGYTMGDVAWMEVCTLRDCIAKHLSWDQIASLQRYLALLSHLAPLWSRESLAAAAEKLARCIERQSIQVSRCLRLLWAIRYEAFKIAPEADQANWSRHYLQHITLAACRTFKWPGTEQTGNQVAASVVTAGVASERLDLAENSMFTLWSPEDVAIACAILLEDPQEHSWESADLLTTAFLAHNGKKPHEDCRLAEQALARLFNGPLAAAVEERQRQCRDTDFSYIPLEGRELAPGEPCVQQGEGALTVTPHSGLHLLTRHRAVVLIGDSGAGTTTVTRELQSRMLAHLSSPEGTKSPHAPSGIPPCLPLTVSALDLSTILSPSPETSPAEKSPAQVLCDLSPLSESLSEERMRQLLAIGAIHLTVDDLHKVDTPRRGAVVTWLKSLHRDKTRLRIVVCHRGWDYQPELFGWPAVVLHKVREQQARTYIADRLRKRYPDTWEAKFAQLEERLFQDPDAVALRDLAGKPLFLWMLVEHFKDVGEVSSNPGTLVHRYLMRLLEASNHGSEVERKLALLALLVRRLGDSGSALRREEAVKEIARLAPDNAEPTLQALLATSALQEQSSWITFCNPLVQAYCAASALEKDAEADLDAVTKNILKFGWRDAAHLLVANPDVAESTVSAVLKAAVRAHPWYGALLLQAAHAEAAEIRQTFVDQQKDVLRSERSGRPAWQKSAYALAKYGTEQAMRILKQVARSKDSAPGAAEAALDGLVMMHQWFVPQATNALQEVLQHLLDPGPDVPAIPVSLQVRALRSVQAAGLTSLVGLAWARLSRPDEWPVIDQAWKALRQLRVLPDRALRHTYKQACIRRLAEIDTELRMTTATRTVDALNTQRLQLLRELAAEGEMETLLNYRFRAGLVESPDWKAMLQFAAETRHRNSPHDVFSAALLSEPEPGTAGEEWLDLLRARNDYLAVIGAHRLLSEGYVVNSSLLEEINAKASPQRLSIVAAFVHSLALEDLDAVERLVEHHVSDLKAAYVEPLASLVSAACTLHHATGLRLAVLVQEALLQGGLREVLHWPWSSTWRAALPDRAETAFFLDEHQDNSTAKLAALSSVDVLLDAPFAQPMLLSSAEREQLLSMQPDSPDGLPAHRFVLLAASAGLYEALPFVHKVAKSTDNIRDVVTHSTAAHGLVELSLAAHAITALGYLGRLALLEDLTEDAKAAFNTLQQMARDTAGLHPSLERARLTGLGFWGEWQDILTALDPEDCVLARTASNIVAHWLPAPGVHQSEDCFGDIARWIANRLQYVTLPARTHEVLTQIRDSTETRLGRYVH